MTNAEKIAAGLAAVPGVRERNAKLVRPSCAETDAICDALEAAQAEIERLREDAARLDRLQRFIDESKWRQDFLFSIRQDEEDGLWIENYSMWGLDTGILPLAEVVTREARAGNIREMLDQLPYAALPAPAATKEGERL